MCMRRLPIAASTCADSRILYKNKGGRRYHICPTIWCDCNRNQKQAKIGARALSARLFITSIHGSDPRLATPRPSTGKSTFSANDTRLHNNVIVKNTPNGGAGGDFRTISGHTHNFFYLFINIHLEWLTNELFLIFNTLLVVLTNSGFTFMCNHMIDDVDTPSEITCRFAVYFPFLAPKLKVQN